MRIKNTDSDVWIDELAKYLYSASIRHKCGETQEQAKQAYQKLYEDLVEDLSYPELTNESSGDDIARIYKLNTCRMMQ